MRTPSEDMGRRSCTYGDYLHFSREGERKELIGGAVYDMGPAPSRRHQQICVELARQLANSLMDRDCEVYTAPFDVRLPEEDEEDEAVSTVVQPDLVVVCDERKLDERGCRGAPQLIMEVVSPASVAHDQIRKVSLYEKHGVKEYWIVHPADELVTVRVLDGKGRYGIPAIHEGQGKLPVQAVPGLEVDLDMVFRR